MAQQYVMVDACRCIPDALGVVVVRTPDPFTGQLEFYPDSREEGTVLISSCPRCAGLLHWHISEVGTEESGFVPAAWLRRIDENPDAVKCSEAEEVTA